MEPFEKRQSLQNKNHPENDSHLSLGMLQGLPPEVVLKLMPDGRRQMVMQTSKKIRKHLANDKPSITLRSNYGQSIQQLAQGLDVHMQQFDIECIIILCIPPDETPFLHEKEILFETIKKCKKLTKLEIRWSPELPELLSDMHHSGFLSMLVECTSLTHLDLSYNWIGAEGAGRLAAIQSPCEVLF